MSLRKLCRLCLTPFQNDYQPLIDDTGQCNDAYDIACKYFDEMLLLASQELSSPIICSICWRHIEDFYSFQQTVFEAQAKLLDDTKEIALNIKMEPPEQIDDNKLLRVEDHAPIKHEEIGLETLDIQANTNTFTSDDGRHVMESFHVTLEDSSHISLDIKEEPERIVDEQLFGKENPNEGEYVKHETEHNRIENFDIPKEFSSDDDEDDISRTKSFRQQKWLNNRRSIQQKTKENDAIIASWRTELECVKCNGSFANFTLLRQHFLKDHIKDKCYIECCKRKFRKRFQIVDHIRLHRDPNAFRCEVCGKCCSDGMLLKHHMEIHDTNHDYICQICNKGFSTENKCKSHVRIVHSTSYVCDQCGKVLNSRKARNQHMNEHLPERKHKCTFCEKTFKTSRNLRQHEATHTGEALYKCPNCERTFGSLSHVYMHRKRSHQVEWENSRIKKPPVNTDAAARKRKSREKLMSDPEKLKMYLEKERERSRKRRQEKKMELSKDKNELEAARLANRIRIRRYREKCKNSVAIVKNEKITV